MTLAPATLILLAIRIVLVVETVFAVVEANWLAAFVAVATFGLTLLPDRVARRVGVRLPASFLAAIAVFVFATLFLGEVSDFYNRFWWWDIVLHFSSAVSFGLFGFLLIFMLFEGDRYAAPPVAIAFLSFCVAMTIGALWEIFEFGVDQTLGTNMQKSGLMDTMTDLIVDMAGAALGALVGYLYLRGRQVGGLGALIDEFVALNRRFYRRLRRR